MSNVLVRSIQLGQAIASTAVLNSFRNDLSIQPVQGASLIENTFSPDYNFTASVPKPHLLWKP